MQTVVKFFSRLGLFLILCPALLSAAESHRYCRQIRWETDLSLSCRFEISADKTKEVNAYNLVYDDKGRLIRWEYLRAGQKAIENHLVPSSRVFEYNAQGYKISNLNYQGQPAPDSQGIYSWLLVRDEQKHQATLSSYDQYGKLKNNQNECAGRNYVLDEKGRINESYCQSAGRAQGLSRGASKGLFVYSHYTYDAQGNIIEAKVTDENGLAVQNSFGVSDYKYKYDQAGNLIEEKFFNLEGKLVENQALTPDWTPNLVDEQGLDYLAGAAMVRYQFGDFGNPLELRFFGTMGDKVEVGKGNAHLIKMQYDSRGNLVEVRFYNKNDHLLMTTTKKWAAVVKMKFDEMGNLAERSYYDNKEKPALEKQEKAAVVKNKYDAHRNLVEVSYFGPNGKPVAGILGSAVVRYVYDEGDRRIEERFFDKDDKPAEAGDGKVAIIKHKYDQWNQIAETSYFGKDDQFKLHKKMKIATVKMVLDYQGHVLEKRFFGKDGKPKNYRQHAVEKCEYDDIGAMTERKYYNTNGREITWIY